MWNDWNIRSLPDNPHTDTIMTMAGNLIAQSQRITPNNVPIFEDGAIVLILHQPSKTAQVVYSKSFRFLVAYRLPVGQEYEILLVKQVKQEEEGLSLQKLLVFWARERGFTVKTRKKEYPYSYVVEETSDFLGIGQQRLYCVFTFCTRWLSRKGLVAIFTNRFHAYEFVRLYKGFLAEATTLLPKYGENVPDWAIDGIARYLEHPRAKALYNNYKFNMRRDNPDEKFTRLSYNEFQDKVVKHYNPKKGPIVNSTPPEGKRTCKVCNQERVYIYKSLSKNRYKLYVDENGSYWNGRTCPFCMKENLRQRNQKKSLAWKEYQERLSQEQPKDVDNDYYIPSDKDDASDS